MRSQVGALEVEVRTATGSARSGDSTDRGAPGSRRRAHASPRRGGHAGPWRAHAISLTPPESASIDLRDGHDQHRRQRHRRLRRYDRAHGSRAAPAPQPARRRGVRRRSNRTRRVRPGARPVCRRRSNAFRADARTRSTSSFSTSTRCRAVPEAWLRAPSHAASHHRRVVLGAQRLPGRRRRADRASRRDLGGVDVRPRRVPRHRAQAGDGRSAGRRGGAPDRLRCDPVQDPPRRGRVLLQLRRALDRGTEEPLGCRSTPSRAAFTPEERDRQVQLVIKVHNLERAPATGRATRATRLRPSTESSSTQSSRGATWTASSIGPTCTCRCTVPRASASGWPRRCTSASRSSRRPTRGTWTSRRPATAASSATRCSA